MGQVGYLGGSYTFHEEQLNTLRKKRLETAECCKEKQERKSYGKEVRTISSARKSDVKNRKIVAPLALQPQ